MAYTRGKRSYGASSFGRRRPYGNRQPQFKRRKWNPPKSGKDFFKCVAHGIDDQQVVSAMADGQGVISIAASVQGFLNTESWAVNSQRYGRVRLRYIHVRILPGKDIGQRLCWSCVDLDDIAPIASRSNMLRQSSLMSHDLDKTTSQIGRTLKLDASQYKDWVKTTDAANTFTTGLYASAVKVYIDGLNADDKVQFLVSYGLEFENLNF